MRILVIGGTKFIGPHVVRQLTAGGHDVTVYHRGETEVELPLAVRHVHHAAAAIPVLAFPDELLEPAPAVVIHMIPMGEHDIRAAVEAFRGRRSASSRSAAVMSIARTAASRARSPGRSRSGRSANPLR